MGQKKIAESGRTGLADTACYNPAHWNSNMINRKAPSSVEVTRLLLDWNGGDERAFEELVPVVYQELRRMARRHMAGERPNHTLQASALVNEAYLKLIDSSRVHWQNRAHFFAVSAQLMRRILVDFARRRHYDKRGGGARQVTLNEDMIVGRDQSKDLLAVDDALKALALIDPRKSQVVELRYFGGLSVEETAEALKVSPRHGSTGLETGQGLASSGAEQEGERRWCLTDGLKSSGSTGGLSNRMRLSAQPSWRKRALAMKRCGGKSNRYLHRTLPGMASSTVPRPNCWVNPPFLRWRLASSLGPYRIEALLGTGGMGEVYKARDTRLGRAVAIKISGERFTERFEREARAISALNHPYICTLYDVGPNYLVMELVEGETLAERLRNKPLPMDFVLRYGAQIAEGLAAAHTRGIIHRDLKPANIMIAKSGIKILDFGLARFTNPGDTLTASRVVMGTPAYMPPEQIEGKECDARTDIFALGLVLYEMSTGKRALSQGQPAPMEGLPTQFAHVVERCLEQDPENRWQSASDIKAELEWAGKRPTLAQAPARNASVRLAWGSRGGGLRSVGRIWSCDATPRSGACI